MTMTAPAPDRLRELNDPLLWPMIDAAGEADREAAIGAVIADFVRPLVATMIGRFRRSEADLRAEDFDELASIVGLRLIRRLRAAALFEEQGIASLGDYVATLSFHALYDLRRQRHPERHRLKKNLRYVLTRDPRFAIWETPAAVVCGLVQWRARTDVVTAAMLTRASCSAAARDRRRPGDALNAILLAIGGPVKLDVLVDAVARVWDIRDAVLENVEPLPDTRPDPLGNLERKQYLAMLWSEILELPDGQRIALLLNLRDSAGENALALFLLLGIADLASLARAMSMNEKELNATWERLPMDDLSIASRLGLRRQQVINLRQAARSRLARRMTKRK